MLRDTVIIKFLPVILFYPVEVKARGYVADTLKTTKSLNISSK